MIITDRKRVLFRFVEVLMILLSLAMLLPFYFAFINSIKSSGESSLLNFAFPSELHFENYISVFGEAHILRGLKNSVIISGTSVFFLILLASLTAFVIDRRNTKTTKFIFNFFVFGIIPSGFLIPTVYTLKAIGLYGTFAGLDMIYIAGGAPTAVFLITGFMKTVPKAMDESAILDGCGMLKLFFKIIFPQLKPIIATTIIISFMASWNDFISPMIYLTKSSQYTIPMSVYAFNSMYNTQWEKVFAVLLMAAAPIIIVYAIAQEYIIEGMTAGAVKG